MQLPEQTTIELRRGFGVLTVDPLLRGTYVRVGAYRCGDWAAHRHVDNPEHWVLTLLPLGANLDPYEATFLDPKQAYAAAVDIQRMRNDWHVITQADLKLPLKARLIEICKRHGAIHGLVGITQRADLSIMGVRKSQRPNGYGAALG